jgi:release factor glutamine methyltransferase
MMPEVWTILKILNWTRQFFQSKGVENPRLDAEILLCDVLHCERIQLYTHFDQPLEPGELAAYRAYVVRRARREPVAYILGHKGFMNYEFKVTKDTLIPRPETELLVEQLISLLKDDGHREILDLGCGSGAILLSLLKALPEARGLGIDLNPGAVAVTMENAETLGVEERCAVLVSDLFSNIPDDERFDLIVSNPPYIPQSDLPGLQPEVREEPRMALDGGADGLDFYRRILNEGPRYLEEDGFFAFEIGIHQAEAVASLCRDAGYTSIRILKDYGSIERMIFASKEGSVYGNKIMEIKER